MSVDPWGTASARAFYALIREPDLVIRRGFDPSTLATPWLGLVERLREWLETAEGSSGPRSSRERCTAFLRAFSDEELEELGVGSAEWLIASLRTAVAERPMADGLEELAEVVRLHDEQLDARLEAKQPTPAPKRAAAVDADGAALLDEVAAFIRRFVVASDDQVVAITLWIAHTHGIEAAESTPYLGVTSAEKRSGKSRLVVELLPLLTPRPLAAANISVAALARSIAVDPPPTLLLDEADATFGQRGRGGSSERAEDLRGILNAGYRRGATYTRMAGQGAAMKPESFAIFGAKALAGIGELPDTIADRSILVRMKRKAPGEPVERFRRREVEPLAHALRDRLAAWMDSLLEALTDARPQLPDALDDRAADGWEPLLAIADAAGAHWPAKGRSAALALSAGRSETGPLSSGVALLADIRGVFDEREVDRLGSAALCDALNALEEAPWGGWRDGQGLTARVLGPRLRGYDVVPGTIRLPDGVTLKGYRRAQFADAWERYCAPPGGLIGTSDRHTVTTQAESTMRPGSEPSHADGCDGSRDGEIPDRESDVTVCRPESAGTATGDELDRLEARLAEELGAVREGPEAFRILREQALHKERLLGISIEHVEVRP